MKPFIAAYVTTGSEEWDRPLCVAPTKKDCKDYFCRWYANVDYNDCSVRYAPVNVLEVK